MILVICGAALLLLQHQLIKTGNQKKNSAEIHLPTYSYTTTAVSSLHGKPLILTILAKEMRAAGYPFYFTENNVWLKYLVPPTFIQP
jgi:putative RNA 2'-phosphotransferase